MAKPSILLTHTPSMRANYYGARALAGLQALGDVRLHEGADPLEGAALIAAASGCQIMVADRATAVPAEVLDALPELAVVLRVAVDIRNIDVAAASRNGILVTHAGRSWVPAVSELVIGLMIDAARGMSRANIAYKRGDAPSVDLGRQLHGSTAGIIGFGPLAQRVAQLCLGFGMRVIVHDPYVTVAGPGLEAVPLEMIFTDADFVVPLAVATDETECIVNAERLRMMKPDALLVNLSRGNLIDEAAPARALDEGWIAGAALDVGRAPDQMPSPHLAVRPAVSATTHIGGLTQDAIEGQALETVEQVRALLDGRVPIGAANDAQATRLVGSLKHRIES